MVFFWWLLLLAGLLLVIPWVFFLYFGPLTRGMKGKKKRPPQVWGFFHPYCSGGGGGERVLWKMIQVLQQQQQRRQTQLQDDKDGKNERGIQEEQPTTKNLQCPNNTIVIFTIDPPGTDEALLRKDAEQRFDVTIPYPVQLVSLEAYKKCLEPAPFLSLVLESWGTMKLAYHALRLYKEQQHHSRTTPSTSSSLDVFCDTTGCAFTFVVAKLLVPTCWIVAYVHYPTISTDMMQWEWNTRGRSAVKRQIKLIYYQLFAILYGMVGSLADLVMVNSTWTYHHIQSLWWYSKRINIVYPPCRVAVVEGGRTSGPTPAVPERNRGTIVSIGQFRPEKDHKLQIEAVACYLKRYHNINDGDGDEKEKDGPKNNTPIRLILIGSCRNDQDRARVEELRRLVVELKLDHVVQFNLNPPYSELQAAMEQASMGIHTMRQEHFGIGIVEMMASGLLTMAHNSGGPQTDIIVEPGVTGFLATTSEEYATAIHTAMTMDAVAVSEMRHNAQQSAMRFSDDVFDRSLAQCLTFLTR
jgi:alpha-1,2-mannosyltransferase